MSNLSLIPHESEWKQLKEICQIGITSGFLPSAIKTPQQAAIIALKGRELGIPPMQAFSSIAVIQGKPTMGAELMLALIYKNCQGAAVNFLEVSDKKCALEAKRPGKDFKFCRFEFTLEDAKKANLLSKDSWVKYPRAMLKARAITEMARTIFPDAISGVSYTAEELGADVEITEDGTIEVFATPQAPSPQPPRPEPKTIEPKVIEQEPELMQDEPPMSDEECQAALEIISEAERELDQMATDKIAKEEPKDPPRPKRKYNGPNPNRGNFTPCNADDMRVLRATATAKKFTDSQVSSAIKKLTGKQSSKELTREDAWDVIGYLSLNTIHDLATLK